MVREQEEELRRTRMFKPYTDLPATETETDVNDSVNVDTPTSAITTRKYETDGGLEEDDYIYKDPSNITEPSKTSEKAAELRAIENLLDPGYSRGMSIGVSKVELRQIHFKRFRK